jgi:lipopolysaccharide/colanic/teichoic acid biosynthesis glycosyltransferase
MRLHPPTARAGFAFRLAPYDVGMAVLSPYLALQVRDAAILSTNATMVLLYCGISLICSLGAFLAFRIEGSIPRYFSPGDALNLAKAVIIGELLTASLVFSFTRLDGVPRTVPAIHALMLGTGLFAARAIARFVDGRRQAPNRAAPGVKEHIILIGLSDLSALLIQFLETVTPSRYQVIALLDTEPRLVGQTVRGVPVCGPPSHLGALIKEFAVHGVYTDRVIIDQESNQLPMQQIRLDCARLNLNLSFVSDLFTTGLTGGTSYADRARAETGRPNYRGPAVTASRYFRVKARVEFPIVMAIVIFVLPIYLITAVSALLDVGPPILFWQRRVGLHGRHFQLYKIRTLRAAFDHKGQKVRKAQRLSKVGRLLRRTRLDELPQLLSVLVGDMSLIGPRPLLSEDQPPNPAIRLMVRPGLTGWAQVNGGALLSPEEKQELDEWYVRRASPWLDLRIIAFTFLCLVRGDRRSEKALAQARGDQDKLRIIWTSPTPERAAARPLRDKGRASAMRAR